MKPINHSRISASKLGPARILCILVVTCLAFAAREVHAEEVVIDQVADLTAEEQKKMFKFIPDYVEINVGDSIYFKGMTGQHSARSVKGMIPEGAEHFERKRKGSHTVKFTVPGVYGVRCKVHGRHGMVALVVVGNDIHNLEQARVGAEDRLYPHAAAKMQELLDKARDQHGN